jgi:predicted dehydrogenase
MNFALLGIDDLTFRIARFLVQQPQHALLVAVVPPPDVARVATLAPRIATNSSWEDLIAAREVDAILVSQCQQQELVDEQLRKLAQAARPLLVSHPLCSAIVAYEVDMIRRDVGGVVLPVFPGRNHPCLRRLRSWSTALAESPIGRLEQVDLERLLERHDRLSVTRALALDLRLLGNLLGEVTAVHAVGSRPAGELVEHLTVHLEGKQPVVARWSSIPRGEPAARLKLFGSSGTATLELSSEGIPRRLEVNGVAHADRDFERWDDAAATIDDLETAMAGRPYETTWEDICRDLEVAETAELSLRRRRSLDVFAEPPTEESSFKGLMAAGSCGLLLAILAAFVILAILEGLRAPLPDFPRQWPLVVRLWPVYPLVAFLALQFLLIVARRPGRRYAPSPASAVSGSHASTSEHKPKAPATD